MSKNKFTIPLIINLTILFLLFCHHLILEKHISSFEKSEVEIKSSLEKPAPQPVLEILEIEQSKLKVSGMDFPQAPSLNAPLKRKKLETIYENRHSKLSHNSVERKTPNKHKLNALKMKKYSSGLIPMRAQQLQKEKDRT